MASKNTPTEQTIRQEAENRAAKCVTDLVDARARNSPLPAEKISEFLRVIVQFENSENRRFPPTKAQFTQAVQSIIMEGDGKLSPQWNKQQLAACLTRWLTEALALEPFNRQPDLFAKVQISKRNPKELEHSVFLVDEDSGNISTFEIRTPATTSPTTSRPSPSPILAKAGENEDFLAELDRLLNSPSLAAIPVI